MKDFCEDDWLEVGRNEVYNVDLNVMVRETLKDLFEKEKILLACMLLTRGKEGKREHTAKGGDDANRLTAPKGKRGGESRKRGEQQGYTSAFFKCEQQEIQREQQKGDSVYAGPRVEKPILKIKGSKKEGDSGADQRKRARKEAARNAIQQQEIQRIKKRGGK